MSDRFDEPHDGAHEIGAAEAIEAAFEGVSGAVSLGPSSGMPALGGELLLPTDHLDDHDDIASDTVRQGIMQAGPLAIAGVATNALNVVVTILIARALSTRDYGLLNQLTALFLIISMPGSAIIVAVVRRVTAWDGRGDGHRVRAWARRVHSEGTVGVIVFIGVIAALGGLIASGLNQPNALGVIAILSAAAIWVLLSLDRGLLQAHRSYRSLAVNLLVEGGARTVFMIGFAFTDLGASGLAVGIMLGELVTAIHARFAADAAWASRETDAAAPRSASIAVWLKSWMARMAPDPELRAPRAERRHLAIDLIVALCSLAMLAVLQNVDILIVGKDNPKLSGSYAAVSVASKAIVYGAVVLGSYLLPEAAIRWREGGHALRQLFVALLLLAIPATALLIAAVFFPDLLLSLVFSRRYLGAEQAFAPLGLAMVCLSVTVVLTMYLLAVGRRWIAGLLVLGAIAAAMAVNAAHGNTIATARNDLAVQLVLAIAVLVGFVKIHHRRLAS